MRYQWFLYRVSDSEEFWEDSRFPKMSKYEVEQNLPNNWRHGNLCISPLGHITEGERGKCSFCGWRKGIGSKRLRGKGFEGRGCV